MRTEHLSYLLEIARQQSVNKASKILHINQQHLSGILTAVENELGDKLFERSYKGVIPTAQGQIALEKIQTICSEVEALQAIFQTSKEESIYNEALELKIYSMVNIYPELLLENVEMIEKMYPNLSISLSEIGTSQAVAYVSKDSMAIGLVTFVRGINDIEGLMNDQVEYIKCAKMPLVAIVDAYSPLRRKFKTISLNALLTQQLALYSPYPVEENIHYQLLSSKGEPQIRYVLSNLLAFHRVMHKGDSLSLGCKPQMDYQDMAQYAVIPIRDNIEVESGIVINKENKQHPLVQDFIECYMRSRYR